jgi:hypothetical protein
MAWDAPILHSQSKYVIPLCMCTGGNVDVGESRWLAAQRELKEECGIVLTPTQTVKLVSWGCEGRYHPGGKFVDEHRLYFVPAAVVLETAAAEGPVAPMDALVPPESGRNLSEVDVEGKDVVDGAPLETPALADAAAAPIPAGGAAIKTPKNEICSASASADVGPVVARAGSGGGGGSAGSAGGGSSVAPKRKDKKRSLGGSVGDTTPAKKGRPDE